ncbi:MAG TPA: hypothetical protein VMM37_02130 [Bacteroidota bacterium]|nr:hypothetical protein [Bacteroidota bacterium]
MKSYKAIAAALIFAAVPALGQPATDRQSISGGYFCRAESYRTMDLSRANQNYTLCLRSENDGIVESALAHVAYMRLVLPGADLRDVRKIVESLVNSDRLPVVRYKAYLASMVFVSPHLFKQAPDVPYATGDEFFAAVDDKLRSSLLGCRAD